MVVLGLRTQSLIGYREVRADSWLAIDVITYYWLAAQDRDDSWLTLDILTDSWLALGYHNWLLIGSSYHNWLLIGSRYHNWLLIGSRYHGWLLIGSRYHDWLLIDCTGQSWALWWVCEWTRAVWPTWASRRWSCATSWGDQRADQPASTGHSSSRQAGTHRAAIPGAEIYLNNNKNFLCSTKNTQTFSYFLGGGIEKYK